MNEYITRTLNDMNVVLLDSYLKGDEWKAHIYDAYDTLMTEVSNHPERCITNDRLKTLSIAHHLHEQAVKYVFYVHMLYPYGELHDTIESWGRSGVAKRQEGSDLIRVHLWKLAACPADSVSGVVADLQRVPGIAHVYRTTTSQGQLQSYHMIKYDGAFYHNHTALPIVRNVPQKIITHFKQKLPEDQPDKIAKYTQLSSHLTGDDSEKDMKLIKYMFLKERELQMAEITEMLNKRPTTSQFLTYRNTRTGTSRLLIDIWTDEANEKINAIHAKHVKDGIFDSYCNQLRYMLTIATPRSFIETGMESEMFYNGNNPIMQICADYFFA